MGIWLRKPSAVLALLAAISVCTAVPSQALTLSFSGDDFSGSNDIPLSEVATAVFTQVDANNVSLTLTLKDGIAGNAFIGAAYFNYDGSLTGISASHTGGVAPSSISISSNAFKADGDGKYDFLIDFGANALTETKSTTIKFTRATGISEALFESLSQPDGGHGPFLAALHIQGWGRDQSSWNAGEEAPPQGNSPVPLPGAILLMGTVLAGAGGITALRRRRQRT